MSFTNQLAQNFRAMHFGPSMVGTSLKDALEGVDWEQATKEVHDLNTIAKLVFHINYYISAVLKVLKGGPLDAHDKYSYDLPPINSEEDWERLLDKTWREAEEAATIMENMTDEQLAEPMDTGKYGDWFKNLLIIQEHSHYHLGQIVLLKKLTQ